MMYIGIIALSVYTFVWLTTCTYTCITSMFGHIIHTSTIHHAPKHIEVLCMVKFLYATSAWLALPYVHCHVSILFPDVPITAIGTAILTSNFNF